MSHPYEAILARFPQFRERIEKRIEKDDDFKTLCSDYEQCMLELSSMKDETEQMQTKWREYMEIKIELEQELLKYVLFG